MPLAIVWAIKSAIGVNVSNQIFAKPIAIASALDCVRTACAGMDVSIIRAAPTGSLAT